MVICAGAVFSAKGDSLTLDKAIVLREVSFYALSILLLYLALQDKRPIEGDEEDHIFISFYDAVMVFVGYILYVWVCANMDWVVAVFSKEEVGDIGGALTAGTSKSYGTSAFVKETSINVDENLPFLHEKDILSHEPKKNFLYEVELYRTMTGEKAAEKPGPEEDRNQDSMIGKTLRAISQFSDGASVRPFAFMMHVDKPSYHYGLYDVEVNNVSDVEVLNSFKRLRCVSHIIIISYLITVRRTHELFHVAAVILLQQGSTGNTCVASSLVYIPRQKALLSSEPHRV